MLLFNSSTVFGYEEARCTTERVGSGALGAGGIPDAAAGGGAGTGAGALGGAGSGAGAPLGVAGASDSVPGVVAGASGVFEGGAGAGVGAGCALAGGVTPEGVVGAAAGSAAKASEPERQAVAKSPGARARRTRSIAREYRRIHAEGVDVGLTAPLTGR